MAYKRPVKLVGHHVQFFVDCQGSEKNQCSTTALRERGNCFKNGPAKRHIVALGEESYEVPSWTFVAIICDEGWGVEPFQISGSVDPHGIRVCQL